MAPIRSTTSIRSERLSQQVLVASDAVDRSLLVSNIVDTILRSGLLVQEAQSSTPSTPSDASSSTPSRRRRRHVPSRLSKPGHIPRPPNVFILFRSECVEELKKRLEGKVYDSNAFSKHVGKHWHSLSKEQQEMYKELAREAARIHKDLYPDYKFKPEKHKRGKGKKDVEEETVTIALAADFVPYIQPTPVTPEPEVAAGPIVIPVLTWPIQHVNACVDTAPPPSHPVPVAVQYDFADGTALPPCCSHSDPQASFKADVIPENCYWYPSDNPVNDSSFSLGPEESPLDSGNLDDVAIPPEFSFGDWLNLHWVNSF
ncbi:hypothetical protein DFS33DRAFT_253588 [Desarmillaria ectypa]|nr:hypothetical protein DFS33DRAFT_253588 [Desarmillaria ectypa]